MILLIDNYDSFSYNLYQLVGSMNSDIRVIRNDAYTVDEVRTMQPSSIILSPGPGRPEDAGITMDVCTQLSPSIPTLGVCLGMQAMCAAYGTTITYAQHLMHGKQSDMTCDTSSTLFRGCPAVMPVARYHSLVADPLTLPNCLKVTGTTDDGEIMAVEHTEYPLYGVQFHPESILTPDGKQMLKNFLDSQLASTTKASTVKFKPVFNRGLN